MRLNKQFYLPILITLLTVTGPIQAVTAAEVMTADNVKTDKKLRLPNAGRSDLQELIQRVASGDTGDGQPTEPEPDEIETPEVAEVEQPKAEADPQVEQPLAKTDSKPTTSGKAPRAMVYGQNGTCDWEYQSDGGNGKLIFSLGKLAEPIATNLAMYGGDAKDIRTITIRPDVEAPESVAYLFANLPNVDRFEEMHNLQTHNTISMAGWFVNDTSMTTVNDSFLLFWDTSSVVDMSHMFENTDIDGPDLQGWNTSNVRNMSYMFANCPNFYGVVGIGQWDTSQVTNFNYMFYNNTGLTVEEMPPVTGNNATMRYMFYGTTNLNILYASYANLSKVVDMSYMFAGTKLTSLDLSAWDVNRVTNFDGMFRDSNFNELNLSGWRNNNPSTATMANMFDSTYNLHELILTNFKTNKVTKMTAMFLLTGLAELDLQMWNVDSVTTFHGMFSQTQKLENLNLSGWRNSASSTNVSMGSMFYGATELENLVLTNFKTDNVIDMSDMLAHTKLVELDLHTWNVSKVTTFSRMFNTMSDLTDSNLSGWRSNDSQTVTTMNAMFQKTSRLKQLNLSGFTTENVTGMANMFDTASQLESLDLSSWNMLSLTSSADMFANTPKLWQIILGVNVKFPNDPSFTAAPAKGTEIVDGGQTYYTTAASWQIVDNGTLHKPRGKLVLPSEMWQSTPRPVVYVWAQTAAIRDVSNLEFGTLGAGDFRGGKSPMALNMATGQVDLENLEDDQQYIVKVKQDSNWRIEGDDRQIDKSDLKLKYGDDDISQGWVEFWQGTSEQSPQKILKFNHDQNKSFTLSINPLLVIQSALLSKPLESSLIWSLDDVPE